MLVSASPLCLDPLRTPPKAIKNWSREESRTVDASWNPFHYIKFQCSMLGCQDASNRRYGDNHLHTMQLSSIQNQEATNYKKQNWGQWACQQIVLGRCSSQLFSRDGRKRAGGEAEGLSKLKITSVPDNTKIFK